MILLKQDNTNKIAVTLNEDTTQTGTTYYLWSLTSDDTNSSVEFIGTDLSTNQCRYNEFDVILTGTTDINLTASTISLIPTGSWKYEVFQQNSNTNLDLSLTGDLVEQGRVVVSGVTVPTIIACSGDSPTYIT